MSTEKDKYSETVFLPKTDFPMRGNLPEAEPAHLKHWEEIGLYQKMRDATKGRPKWVLHDGPPYANGNIHMGHALNKILKDVVVKSYAMMGYDTPYVPGWDCHGLPIEWKIEEKYRAEGKDKDEVDLLTFRDECRNFAREWVDIQAEQFKRLGVSGDWDNPYMTMTNRAEGLIVREIHKFVSNGLLYKGAKPVMWSTVEKTALAEAEVEYKEHKSVTIWVGFPIVKPSNSFLDEGNIEIPIWTTTPWTMPSNRAIACGAALDYQIYQVDEVSEDALIEPGRKFILAKKLANNMLSVAMKVTKYSEIGPSMKGSDIVGTICKHPLYDKGYNFFKVPVLTGDFVEDTAGTGFVHVAPGHGEDDFYLGQKHGIEVTDNVSDDGKFRDHVPLFAGEEVYDKDGKLGGGNFSVLRELNEAGKLLAKGSMRHEYPHSWRSKAPLIFRTTPQWFIALDKNGNGESETLREKALSEISKTRWVPGKGEARIRSMIENRPDWCISRQRAWGVPIAIFVHKETGENLDDEDVLNRIGEIFETDGADAWWSRDAQDFLGNTYSAADYDQVFDIVDVWFESGSTHAFVVGDTKTWPDFEDVQQIDLYLEGSDQHRGWFHSSLLESCGSRGRAPYKSVLTHGFVLDEKGYKMSKSLGNVVDPLKLMDQYGADILRLWALTSDYAEDIRIGKDTLKNTGDLYRRMRNTLRFLLGALDGYTKDEAVALDENLPELEQLMLHQLFEMDQKVRNCIEAYDFQKLTKALHEFCNESLSAFYFDIRKDRLYCDAEDSYERRACRTVMAAIFDCLTGWLAPVLCFTAEEAWQHRPKDVFGNEESVHLRTYPDVPKDWHNPELAGKWFAIREVREAVLAAIEPARKEKTIGSSLEAAPLVKLNSDFQKALEGLDLAEIAITSSVRVEAGDGVAVTFEKADGEKCQRCWKVLPEVAESSVHLCQRCTMVVADQESRAA